MEMQMKMQKEMQREKKRDRSWLYKLSVYNNTKPLHNG